MLLGLGLTLSAPWWLLRMATTGRYREGLRERLGRVPDRVRAAVAGRQVIWVHAVSVGEVLAVSRLVAELGTELGAQGGGETWTVVVSTTTRTGQALARERFGAEQVFFFPLDLAWAVRAYLRVLRPALLVLAESELWPRLLHECQRGSVPVVVVNARVSDRSFRRALRAKALWGRLLRKVTLWLAQSDADAHRLVALGTRAEAVAVSGNLKYDVRVPKASRVADLIQRLAGGRQIAVAGSTVAGLSQRDPSEEEIVLGAWARVARREHGTLLVLAPRHPERFDEVYSIARKFPTLRATGMLSAAAAKTAAAAAAGAPGRLGEAAQTECVVLDTIGDLAAVYRVADVAIVGGSLVARGGHNPLEPAQFGVPVAMGASFENFRDIVAKLQSADGIRIVSNEDELAATLHALLQATEDAHSMGERGREVFEREGGATARTVAALLPLVRHAAPQVREAVTA